MPDDELLLPNEAARLLRLDVKTLARWADTGLIPCVPLPSGHRRYRAADVDAIIGRKPEPRVLVWDYRQQPDLDELAEAIADVSRGTVHLTQVDTGSDEHAIVLAARPLDAVEAYELYPNGGGAL